MVGHYQKLFNPGGEEAEILNKPGYIDPEVETKIWESFSLENIKKCKTQLKTGSAPGPDNITYDMLKQTGDAFDTKIHILFNRILKEQEWPKQFQVSLLKSLYKKGRKDMMINYR